MRWTIMILACCGANGCLGAVVWPSVDVTPPVVGLPESATAYRIEKSHWKFGYATLDSHGDTATPTEVPINDGVLSRQTQARLSHYFGLILVSHRESHDFEVVIRRPGFADEVVRSWPWWFALGYLPSQHVTWLEAPPPEGEFLLSPLEQVKANALSRMMR